MTTNLLAEFEPIFYPQSIAVVGASAERGKFGGMFLNLLLTFGYKGKVYPVNPRETEIFGLKTYATVSQIPEPVDFAAISVPADAVPAVVRECLAAISHRKAGLWASSVRVAVGQPECRGWETDWESNSARLLAMVMPVTSTNVTFWSI